MKIAAVKRINEEVDGDEKEGDTHGKFKTLCWSFL